MRSSLSVPNTTSLQQLLRPHSDALRRTSASIMSRIFVTNEKTVQLVSLISSSSRCSDLISGNESETQSSDFQLSSPGVNIPADFEIRLSRLVKDEKRFEYSSRLALSQPVEASAVEESIAWILKVAAFYGFQPLTAYLSISYLNRFLSARQFPSTCLWAYQLLSVACLSLAAKMEEVIIPSLTDLQMEGVIAKHIFEPKTVQRMELLVLSVLDWRLRSITPFNFLPFFAYKLECAGRYGGFLCLEAGDIILAAVSDARIFQYRPSCIAAAALLCVAKKIQCVSQMDSEIAESWCDGLSKEEITSCCDILHNIVLKNSSMQFGILSELHSSSPSSESSCSSSSPSKRRKLNDHTWS